MRSHICYTALGLALAAATPAAHAQTVIEQMVPPSGILVPPPAQTVATVPVETVETVRTVRRVDTTARHRTTHRIARNQPANVVTTTRRTVRRERILPEETAIAAAPAYAAAAVAAYPQPLYDVVVPTPDEPFVPAPAVVQPVIGAAVASAPVALPAYQYVYEPDRILVIDANTGIAVQAIPR